MYASLCVEKKYCSAREITGSTYHISVEPLLKELKQQAPTLLSIVQGATRPALKPDSKPIVVCMATATATYALSGKTSKCNLLVPLFFVWHAAKRVGVCTIYGNQVYTQLANIC